MAQSGDGSRGRSGGGPRDGHGGRGRSGSGGRGGSRGGARRSGSGSAARRDATGKEAFAATRNGWRKPDPYLNKVDVWTYYEGAIRQEGIDEGTTGVAFVPEKGWFWWIPLHDNRLSLGVVAEGKYLSREGVRDPKAILEREIEKNNWVKDNLAPA